MGISSMHEINGYIKPGTKTGTWEIEWEIVSSSIHFQSQRQYTNCNNQDWKQFISSFNEVCFYIHFISVAGEREAWGGSPAVLSRVIDGNT
jgi:hypothetical protein